MQLKENLIGVNLEMYSCFVFSPFLLMVFFSLLNVWSPWHYFLNKKKSFCILYSSNQQMVCTNGFNGTVFLKTFYLNISNFNSEGLYTK